MRRLITLSILLACSALLALPSLNSAVRGQVTSGPAVRSALATLERGEKARLTVVNAGETPGVRVVVKLLVWDRTTDRTAIRHSVAETFSTGEVTLAAGEGISLDYADAECRPHAECKSVSGIIEFPDGPDLGIKGSVQMVTPKGEVKFKMAMGTN